MVQHSHPQLTFGNVTDSGKGGDRPFIFPSQMFWAPVDAKKSLLPTHPVAGDLNLLVKIYHRIFLSESDTYHLVII